MNRIGRLAFVVGLFVAGATAFADEVLLNDPHSRLNPTWVAEVVYPQFPEFLRRKLAWDPDERFQSDWYRFYRRMFATELAGSP